MSVIKPSIPAASCWTMRGVEGHSPAAKPAFGEYRNVSGPWVVSHALGAPLSWVYP